MDVVENNIQLLYARYIWTFLMCLSWNAGNLDRKNVGHNALVEFCMKKWHLVMLQVASSTSLSHIAATRAMCHSIPRGGNVGAMAVVAGATGHKIITPLYGHAFNGEIPNTNSPYTYALGWFFARQVSWSAAELDTQEERHFQPLLRAGAASWRVCTVHWQYEFTKKDKVGLEMLQFFYLMLRDHVRTITGDFYHGHRYVDPVMAFWHGKGYCESWTMACAGLFDEIVVVLINYNDGDPPAQLKRNQVLDGIDQTYFGVPGNDRDSHAPLMFFVEAADAKRRRRL